jgi:hypothetical protein
MNIVENNVINTLQQISGNFQKMEFGEQVEVVLRSFQMIIDNGYTMRSLMFGVASNSERQRDYITNSLLPKMVTRAKSLMNTAVSLPELKEHVNADDGDPRVQLQQQLSKIRQQSSSIEELDVIITGAVRIHDELSMDLEQLSYSAIRAGGAQKVAQSGGMITSSDADLLNKYAPKIKTA